MEEKEIEKILSPTKKLIILFIIYLGIAFLLIGLVIFIVFSNREYNTFSLSNDAVKEGQHVELESDSLPIFMSETSTKDNQFYFIEDVNNHIYIVKLSDRTFHSIIEKLVQENGQFVSPYHIKGVIHHLDAKKKKFIISNSLYVTGKKDVNMDNFSDYFDEFYIQETILNTRMMMICIILCLFSLFFLILALGYILPSILKKQKILSNRELMEDLRIELSNLTETPYKEQHLYLTKKYLISGVQLIKYEDIIFAYTEKESKYGITVGKNLIIQTMDYKKYIVGSIVGTKDNILNNILDDIKSKNPLILIARDN